MRFCFLFLPPASLSLSFIFLQANGTSVGALSFSPSLVATMLCALLHILSKKETRHMFLIHFTHRLLSTIIGTEKEKESFLCISALFNMHTAFIYQRTCNRKESPRYLFLIQRAENAIHLQVSDLYLITAVSRFRTNWYLNTEGQKFYPHKIAKRMGRTHQAMV